jgi:hypothetical protein
VKFTRRHFVGLGFVTLAGGALLFAADRVSRGVGGPGLTDVGTILGDPGVWGARRIGEAWLREHPEESDVAELERLLAPLPERNGPWSLEDPAVRRWLRQRQDDDFTAERIVQLKGWWLSQGEVRFCALLALV